MPSNDKNVNDSSVTAFTLYSGPNLSNLFHENNSTKILKDDNRASQIDVAL